jgi:UDPglucose 6-dehydrogenase
MSSSFPDAPVSNSFAPARAVSVIGLGKLGAPIAACFAYKGYEVIGADVNERFIAAINEGRAPIYEPGLDDMLHDNAARLRATPDVAEAVTASQISFVVVPTPSDAEGGFSLEYVLSACEKIGAALAQKDDYHLVVITSTVLPGSTDGPVRRLLEEKSGKVCGVDFGLCYSPEFIALGSVIRDVLNPDFVLIGESDPRAGEILSTFYKSVNETDAPHSRMSNSNAELAKIAVNTYVTTKISFANLIARLCEKMPGGDADIITGAIGLDKRIGGRYLKGAIAYGGPCFPRDNQALSAFARQMDVPAILAEATDHANARETQLLGHRVRLELQRAQEGAELGGSTQGGGCVGILGLSYKPDTDVAIEAPGTLLAIELLKSGAKVVAFDPAAGENARTLVGRAGVDLELAGSALECVQNADVVVVATPWREFKELLPTDFEREGRPRVVIDCWRAFDEKALGESVRYVALGRGPEFKRD